jgi:hypothetical protein
MSNWLRLAIGLAVVNAGVAAIAFAFLHHGHPWMAFWLTLIGLHTVSNDKSESKS